MLLGIISNLGYFTAKHLTFLQDMSIVIELEYFFINKNFCNREIKISAVSINLNLY